MKFKSIAIKNATLFCATAFAALILGGCSTPETLFPAIPASTNVITGVVTPATPPVTTNLPNATVTAIATEGNAIAPLLPAPFSTALTALLGLTTLIAGYVAQRKNGQLTTANQVTTAIIQGVESAGTAAAAVKAAVATVSKANGVSDAVEAAVNQVTGSQ